VALSLGAACGPTKPSEIPPLAPRPDPGLPLEPVRVPGVPDPEKPSTPGPSLEPVYPARDAGLGAAPEPIADPFRGIGSSIDPPRRDAGLDGPTPPDAPLPPDAPPPPLLPPIPDGGVPPPAR
jgi:hypothetical protein